MEGFGGLFGDPEELSKRMAEFAEQMQAQQGLVRADNAIKLAVEMTVAAYSVGQQIVIAATTLAVGFTALVSIFRIRSFKEAIRLGREERAAEKAAERDAAARERVY